MIITINTENRVISKAVGKIFDNTPVDNVTTFRVGHAQPEEEPVLDYVADEPIFDEATEELYFNPETKEFYTQSKPVVTKPSEEELKARREAKATKVQALQWLADNDWKVNKRMLGEWSENDPRWQDYLAQRMLARAKIDNAESILNS